MRPHTSRRGPPGGVVFATAALLAARALSGCAPSEVAVSETRAASLQRVAELSPSGLPAGITVVAVRSRGRVVTPTDMQSPRRDVGPDGSLEPAEMISVDLAQGRSTTRDVAAVMRTARRNERGVFLYRVEASVGGARVPLCRGDVEGTLVAGRWDATTGRYVDDGSVSWACVDGAAGRCAAAGLLALDGDARGGRDLAACVRALRGDYCGDGRSLAPPGVEVLLSREASLPGAALDARWGPDGALCANGPAALGCPAPPGACAPTDERGIATYFPR